MVAVNTSTDREAYRALPRVDLMGGVTPLVKAERASAELGVNVYLKRDDLSPIGLGGNKLRNLEYLLADAKAKGHTTVVTAASIHSNYLRLFAASCNRLGLKPVVFVRGHTPGQSPVGNMLCVRLLGAEVHFVGTDDPFSPEILDAMHSYDPDAYVIMLALESGPVAALGYIHAVQEMSQQFAELGINPRAIFTAVGSGCTYAGLWAGAQLYHPMEVIGVSVNLGSDFLIDSIRGHIADASALWGQPVTAEPDDVILRHHLKYPGYGQVNPVCLDAVQKFGDWEGVLLDPIYTGKPAAALIEEAARFQPGDSVVLLHTGGSPNLFAHQDQIATALGF